MLTNSTLSRITADAEAYAKIYHHYKDTTYAGMERQTYVEAASVEAERAVGLVEKLTKIRRYTTDNDIQRIAEGSLTKYNQPK